MILSMNDRLEFTFGYANAMRRKRVRAKKPPLKPLKLYVVQCGDFFKIGIATNPATRLVELQVGCPFPLKLLGTRSCVDAGFEEDVLHLRFDQYRTRGEWFKLPPAELAALLDKMAVDSFLCSSEE
jgi:hypothetical protein